MNLINPKIFNLFKAYTIKKLNQDQFKLLQEWINQSSENKEQFSNYLLLYKRTRRIAFSDAIDQNKAWDKVVSKLERPLIKTVKKEFRIIKNHVKYAVAAVFFIALTSAYILTNIILDENAIKAPIIFNNQIEPGTDKATLTLESGEKVYLEKGKLFQKQNATSNGKKIEYTATNINSKKLVYNYLTVPRGGQFYIKLSDGTKVWLNSETKLKYPVNFIEGKTRQVELLYGEVYFEVSPSSKHSGSHFRVYNNYQELEVLGTKFNIKAYKGNSYIHTTLVEGSVAISSRNKSHILVPNQQSRFNLINYNIKIEKVNIKNEIAWINGEFVLQHKSLKDIMKVLSRWYNMDVIFKNKDLEEVRFVGVLRKNQDIIEILNTIKSFNIIKHYEINNNQVILK